MCTLIFLPLHPTDNSILILHIPKITTFFIKFLFTILFLFTYFFLLVLRFFLCFRIQTRLFFDNTIPKTSYIIIFVTIISHSSFYCNIVCIVNCNMSRIAYLFFNLSYTILGGEYYDISIETQQKRIRKQDNPFSVIAYRTNRSTNQRPGCIFFQLCYPGLRICN